ncbi:MAG: alpha/beta hydrolase [Ruminococcaceae bacterium]|nr:alpha/beta hydrolase [Oscillospiraceae bacterium]
MLNKRIPLNPEDETIYLETFAADTTPYVRPAILVIPGGGYGGVCDDREGEPIALAFVAKGYQAFVLHYSVKRVRPYPAQLCEASLAMAHIRDHAEEYRVNPDRVYVTGFSAGGHLAGSLATMWHKPCVYEATGIEYGKNRPTGAMLVYPVVTGIHGFGPFGSFYNLLCKDNPTADELREVSLEANVSERSAPLFVVHTSNDPLVDVRNALVLGAAYREHGLMFEMHIYPDAPHGIALGNAITENGQPKWSDPAMAQWIDHAVYWADKMNAQSEK